MRDYQRPLTFNFELIGQAQNFYSQHNFQPIAVPWVVDEKYIAETKPEGVAFYSTLGGVLVSSAEQSFIQMLDKGWDEPGAYQATTPCFRDEDHDYLHSPYFMKTELFDNENVTEMRLDDMVDVALQFFSQLVPSVILPIGDGTYDIVGAKSGLELGSYGIRQRLHHEWIYGTGLALPRLEQVLEAERQLSA